MTGKENSSPTNSKAPSLFFVAKTLNNVPASMTLALVPPMKEKVSLRAKPHSPEMGVDDGHERQQKFDCQSSHARLQRSSSQRGAMSQTTPTTHVREQKGSKKNEMVWTVHDTSGERTSIGKRSGNSQQEPPRRSKFSPPSATSSPTGSEPDSFLDSLLATQIGNMQNNALTESIHDNVLDSPSAGSVIPPQRGLLRAPSLADVNDAPPSPPEDDDSDDGSDVSDELSFAGESRGGSDHEWSDIEDGNVKSGDKHDKINPESAGWAEPPQLSRAATADGRIEDSISPNNRRSITKRLLQKVGSIGKQAGLAWGNSTHGRIESAIATKRSPRFSRKLSKSFEEIDSSSSSSDDEVPLITNRESEEAPLTPSHEDIMMMNQDVFIEELPLASEGKSLTYGKLQPYLNSPGSSIASNGFPSPNGGTPPVSERLMRRIVMRDDHNPREQLRMQSSHGGLSPNGSSRQARKWPTDEFRGGMSSHAKLPSQGRSNSQEGRSRMRSKSPPPTCNGLSKVGVIDEMPLSFERAISSHERLQTYGSGGGSNHSSSRSASFLKRPVRVVSSSSITHTSVAQEENSLRNDCSISSLSRLQDCGGSLRSLQDSFLVRPSTPTSPFMIQRLDAVTVVPNDNLYVPLCGISSHARLQSHNSGSNRSRTLSNRSSKTLASSGPKEGSKHHGSTESLRSKSIHGSRSQSLISSSDRLRPRTGNESSAFALGASSHARLQSGASDSQDFQGLSSSCHSVSERQSRRSGGDQLSRNHPKLQSTAPVSIESRQLSSSRHSVRSKQSFRSLSDRPPSISGPGLSSRGSGSLHSRQKKTRKVSGEQKRGNKEKKTKDEFPLEAPGIREDVAAAVEQELFECLQASRHRRSTTQLKNSHDSSQRTEFPTTKPALANFEHRADSATPAFTLDFNKSYSDMSAAESKSASDDVYLQLCLPSHNEDGQGDQHLPPKENDSGDVFVQYCWSANVQDGDKMEKDRKIFLEKYKHSQLPIEKRPLKQSG